MLIQFSFGNFLSFKSQSTLSLAASSLKEGAVNENDVMADAGENAGMLLHGAAVFGANASGKSNVVKAFSTFRWLVANSLMNVLGGEYQQVESFRLSRETLTEPSFFEIVFCMNDVIYRYGVEIDSVRVWREWLFQKANKKRAKEMELFFREDEAIAIHPKLGIVRDVVNRKMVRDNALLLSVAAQFKDPTAVNVTQWLTDTVVLTNSDDKLMWDMAALRLDDPEMHRRIVAFSKYADLGIDDIEKVNDIVVSHHTQFDSDGNETSQVSFPFSKNESEGTIKYFQLAYPILNALDKGRCLVIDELDARLHPVLTNKIISLFNSAETNPCHAQLIFTLHDTNILAAGLMRRDQIWFTQKDRFGASELYSLAEYKVRSNASFEKDYLAGKYGAIPIVGNLSRVFNNEKK